MSIQETLIILLLTWTTLVTAGHQHTGSNGGMAEESLGSFQLTPAHALEHKKDPFHHVPRSHANLYKPKTFTVPIFHYVYHGHKKDHVGLDGLDGLENDFGGQAAFRGQGAFGGQGGSESQGVFGGQSSLGVQGAFSGQGTFGGQGSSGGQGGVAGFGNGLGAAGFGDGQNGFGGAQGGFGNLGGL